MALADAFEEAYNIKPNLELMKTLYIPLSMMTGSLSLLDIFTTALCITEKRFMIDFKTVQDSYNKSETQDVSYFRSEYNIADELTKVKKQSIFGDAL